MSRMNYEEAEHIALGRLAGQLHYEITGEKLGLFELPCAEAIERAMTTLAAAEQAVTDLKTGS